MESKRKKKHLIFNQILSFQDISGMLIETGIPVNYSNKESLKMLMLYIIFNNRKLYNGGGKKHFQENKNLASIKHKCIPLVLV